MKRHWWQSNQACIYVVYDFHEKKKLFYINKSFLSRKKFRLTQISIEKIKCKKLKILAKYDEQPSHSICHLFFILSY